MKAFDNIKKIKEYLETKAKEGERVCLDERSTFSRPRRKTFFKKPKTKEQKQADKNISQLLNPKKSFKEKYKIQQKEILKEIFR